MKKRVVVAMSGGVDSSVAAALLKRQGYDVIGMTMCFNLPDSTTRRPSCCGIQGIEDARRVCHKVGIKHYVLNMQKALEKWVIKDFCGNYFKGMTPNPCVRCNQYIKFGVLLERALSLGAEFIATGHYARIEKLPGRRSAGSAVYRLKKAKDKKKDQSYFLYRLNQDQLRHVLFPLGDYVKEEVRGLARKFGLPTADKLASQEICFLPDADYRRFLMRRLLQGHKARVGLTVNPGPVLDAKGNVLGQHKGIAFYTIGQRQGLGVARGYPLYVARIDAGNNTLIVGKKDDVFTKDFLVHKAHFIFRPAKKKIVARVKIRYNHKESKAQIMFCARQVKVCFARPQFAITVGQSAVFYQGNTVLGGGVIDKVLNG